MKRTDIIPFLLCVVIGFLLVAFMRDMVEGIRMV
jgi:hypothetical protein